MSEQRALVHRQETAKATQQALRENLSERRARAPSSSRPCCSCCRAPFVCLKSNLKRWTLRPVGLRAILRVLAKKEASTREKLNALVVARDAARRALDEARTAFTTATAERAALEELERSSETSNPAQAKMMEEAKTLSSDCSTCFTCGFRSCGSRRID